MEGQMSKQERKFIKEAINLYKPKVSVECGTWKGGGSTLAIGEALHDQKQGILYTFEQSEEFYKIASESFKKERPGVAKYIKFHNEDFIEGLNKLNLSQIDFALLDGPGQRKNNCYMIKALEAVDLFMPKGGVIILHDWKMIKCEIIKPFLICSDKWEIMKSLDTQMGICEIIKV